MLCSIVMNADAEADLYRSWYPRARLYGLRHLRDAHAAHDLAQEALMIALAKLREGAINEPERIGSFILGTCRMLLQNQLRAERRRRELLAQYAALESELDDTSAPGELDTRRLAECLQRLPERARTVTVLAYYADRSAEEIGRELGLAPGNVRVIRHRALAALHACMEDGA